MQAAGHDRCAALNGLCLYPCLPANTVASNLSRAFDLLISQLRRLYVGNLPLNVNNMAEELRAHVESVMKGMSLSVSTAAMTVHFSFEMG